MVESMAAAAERIKHYERMHGIKEVESFLDAILAVQEHIDPSLVRPKLLWSVDDEEEDEEETAPSPYDDLWGMDKLKQVKRKRKNRFRPGRKKIFCCLSRSIRGSLNRGSVTF